MRNGKVAVADGHQMFNRPGPGGFCEGEGLASRPSCVQGALLAYGFTHALQGFL